MFCLLYTEIYSKPHQSDLSWSCSEWWSWTTWAPEIPSNLNHFMIIVKQLQKLLSMC